MIDRLKSETTYLKEQQRDKEREVLSPDLYQSTRNVALDSRELFEQRRRRRQRDLRKSKRFRLTKQQFCTCMTLFCTFLCRHCATTTWRYLISCFKENLNKRRRIFFLYFNLSSAPKRSPPGKFAFIWHFRRTGIKATKFILKVTFSLTSPSSMLKLPSLSNTACSILSISPHASV